MEIRKVLILFLGIVTLIYAPIGLMYGFQGFSSTYPHIGNWPEINQR